MTITTSKSLLPKKERILLSTSGYYPARTGPTFQKLIKTKNELLLATLSAKRSKYLVVDFETRRNDYSLEFSRFANSENPKTTTEVIGVGLAWDTGSCYIDWTRPEYHKLTLDLLSKHPRLLAHNVYFDGGYLYRLLGNKHPNWAYCTFALLAFLANEGYAGDTHRLKVAMTEFLGWESSNEGELDEWLVVNKFYKGNRRKDESEENLRAQYHKWLENPKKGLKPDKGEMWRAPLEILSKYCMLDCEATYLLFTEVLEPTLQEWPGLRDYLDKDVKHHIIQHIEQKVRGLVVNKEWLRMRAESITADMEKCYEEIRNMEGVSDIVHKIEQELRAPEYEKEPDKLTKAGKESKNWINWKAKIEKIERGEDPKLNFNLNSGDQLRTLFYDNLDYTPEIFTDTGMPSVSGKALTKLGPAGQVVRSYGKSLKEMGFINQYTEMTETRNTIHPSFRIPGTVSGRLSSNTPNIMQLPKTKRMMKIFEAHPGHVWVDLDFCLHPDTDLLTLRGWVNVLNLKPDDRVWQVNKNTLKGSWVRPSRVIRRKYTGYMYKIQSVRGTLQVTENHTMLYTGQQTHKTRPDKAKLRWVNKIQEGIPSTGAHIFNSSYSREFYAPVQDKEIWMACMLQADGHKGKKTKGTGFTLEIGLPRKRKKAKELLGRSGTVCTRNAHKGGRTLERWSGIHIDSRILDIHTKRFNLSSFPTSQAEVFVEALSFWDGSTGKSGEITWMCKDEYNIDEVQGYLVRSGYEARKGVVVASEKVGGGTYYKLSIRKAKGIRLRESNISKYPYKGLVGCVTVPEGFILVRSEGQVFVTGNCSVEPVVTAEFSGDKNMRFLYEDASRVNDLYLFIGAQIPGEIGDVIRSTGYDPYNSSSEALSKAKKEAKKERSICKTVCLAANYGAGPFKINKTLEEGDIYLPFEQVEAVHSTYWEVFSDVKKFGYHLRNKWMKDGYIVNGFGRPLSVPEEMSKDVLNRFVQSTAHDILLKYARILCGLLQSRRLNWYPALLDLHDAVTIEVREDQADKAVDCFNEALYILNSELQGELPIRGEAVVGKTMADIKEPEED